MADRILLLDCDHKNALAIVRHLGRTRRYQIDVVSYSKASVAFFSRYAGKKFVISNPKREPGRYIDDLLNILGQEKYLVVIPVSYISHQLCSSHKDKILKLTYISIANPEHIELASSKIETYRFAGKIGIPYPEVITLNAIEDINLVETEYPCVIKGPFETGNSIVDYASDKDELVKKFKKICSHYEFKDRLPIIQKYISGEGAGFFAFYKNGDCRNYFIHKRIREYPASGGPSTCAESYFDQGIYESGKKILDHLNWEGVAMVEFKKDNKTGIYNLMEINAKFWGSLDLALVSGVNFPQMLIDNAAGREIEKVDYKRDVRFQWILNGELFHFFEKPWHFFAIARDLFLSKNDIYFSDLKPNLFQLLYIPVHYYKKWFK